MCMLLTIGRISHCVTLCANFVNKRLCRIARLLKMLYLRSGKPAKHSGPH